MRGNKRGGKEKRKDRGKREERKEGEKKRGASRKLNRGWSVCVSGVDIMHSQESEYKDMSQ